MSDTEQLPPLKFKVGVVIERCTGLKAMDLNGKSDPYIKVMVSPGRLDLPAMKQTACKKKTLDPEYWETFVWDLAETFITKETYASLVLEVYDKDRIGKDDFIGSLKVDLSSLFKPVWKLIECCMYALLKWE
jgi:Ca2+-dependent lipid-binding protein